MAVKIYHHIKIADCTLTKIGSEIGYENKKQMQ